MRKLLGISIPPHYLKKRYTDYPTGDQNLIRILGRVTAVDVAPETPAIPVHHPDLFSYPMSYSAEAGQMVLDNRDASTLREYLMRGGLWMIDFRALPWASFEREMKQIFPARRIVDVPPSHAIFSCVL